MVVGSGLLARAFARYVDDATTCVYAAGVSNSGCCDPLEYDRDRNRLVSHLRVRADRFVYFGTCSVADPDAANSMYVQHKVAMEALVRDSGPHLIVRLPQVAGVTPNPHTLLNYLYARISRSERFEVWQNARRNIIDVDDVATICNARLTLVCKPDETINVANTRSESMLNVVSAMERTLRKQAIYDVKAKGSHYEIDCSSISELAASQGIMFGDRYLDSVLSKYYG